MLTAIVVSFLIAQCALALPQAATSPSVPSSFVEVMLFSPSLAPQNHSADDWNSVQPRVFTFDPNRASPFNFIFALPQRLESEPLPLINGRYEKMNCVPQRFNMQDFSNTTRFNATSSNNLRLVISLVRGQVRSLVRSVALRLDSRLLS